MQHLLVSQPPKVFTVQMAWQTDSQSKQDVKAAMMGLRQVYSHCTCNVLANIPPDTLCHYQDCGVQIKIIIAATSYHH